MASENEHTWTTVRLNDKGKKLADKFGYDVPYFDGHFHLVLTHNDRVFLSACDTAARIIASHYFIQLNYDEKTAQHLASLCEEAGAGVKVIYNREIL